MMHDGWKGSEYDTHLHRGVKDEYQIESLTHRDTSFSYEWMKKAEYTAYVAPSKAKNKEWRTDRPTDQRTHALIEALRRDWKKNNNRKQQNGGWKGSEYDTHLHRGVEDEYLIESVTHKDTSFTYEWMYKKIKNNTKQQS